MYNIKINHYIALMSAVVYMHMSVQNAYYTTVRIRSIQIYGPTMKLFYILFIKLKLGLKNINKNRCEKNTFELTEGKMT